MSPHAKSSRRKEHSHEITVFVESCKGSRNKFKFDEESGQIKLSKVLPEGMVFPFDFGFVPGTKGEDGDPLDILVLNDEPSFPGCPPRLPPYIGLLRADQTDKGSSDAMTALWAFQPHRF